MVLNLRPANAAFLEPVVEEQEGRFGGGGERGDRNGGEEGGDGGAEEGGENEDGAERILRVIRECMGGEDGEELEVSYSGGGGGKGGVSGNDEEMEGVET